MSTQNTNKNTGVIIKTLALPFFLLILFYEELLLAPMKKILFPGIAWIIQILPTWMIAVTFVILEIIKIIAKPMVFVAFGFGFLPGLIALIVYMGVSFFSLQLMIHGSEKLRSYQWIDQAFLWVGEKLKPLKEYKEKMILWFRSSRIFRIWKVIRRKYQRKKSIIKEAISVARNWRNKEG